MENPHMPDIKIFISGTCFCHLWNLYLAITRIGQIQLDLSEGSYMYHLTVYLYQIWIWSVPVTILCGSEVWRIFCPYLYQCWITASAYSLHFEVSIGSLTKLKCKSCLNILTKFTLTLLLNWRKYGNVAPSFK